MLTGHCLSITRIKNLTKLIDYCEIQIDFDSLKIFGKYENLLEFLDKDVRYDVVPDIFEGHQITAVANLALVYTIETLDKVEDIRLIPKDVMVRPGCNFDCKALLFGDTKQNAVAYLSSYTRGSSDKTEWADLKMVDMNSKVFNLRIFLRHAEISAGADLQVTLDTMVGKYIKFDVTSTRFGLQTNHIEVLDIPVLCPPEVETAISIILAETKDDAELVDYMKFYDYIETLKKIVFVEPGYNLVYVASELVLINAIQNISNLYDFKLLKRAAITSRGYLLPAKTRFSRPLLNVTKLLKTKLHDDRDLLLILDPTSEEEVSVTKRVYSEIACFSKKLIEERRGLNEEKDFINLNDLRNVTGGLL